MENSINIDLIVGKGIPVFSDFTFVEVSDFLAYFGPLNIENARQWLLLYIANRITSV